MAKIKIDPATKKEIIEIGTEVLKEYSSTEPTTRAGKISRKFSKWLAFIMPIFKFISFKKNNFDGPK